jgi:UDP-glucose-4-epimerase GalE
MLMKTVIVTGGAGYIGSHMVQALRRAGYRPVSVDNLSQGHPAAVFNADLLVEDLADRGAVRAILRRHRPSAIVHLAASCRVEESVENPLLYYRNNVSATLTLLELALESGVPRFVFSSTAAVYGEPETFPIPETHPTRPLNPYGWSKLMGEQLLLDASRAYGIGAVVLRYFNAAGGDPEAGLGEDHRPETHLLPLAVRAALSGEQPLTVHGTDYDTRDGSCVRDYVHVSDLTEAHLLGLKHLEQEGESGVFNLGTGTGTSVLELLAEVEAVTGAPVPRQTGPRRAGDPAVLVASGAKAKSVLGWEPRRPLQDMIRSTYEFLRRHPEGYPDLIPPGLEPQPIPQRAER